MLAESSFRRGPRCRGGDPLLPPIDDLVDAAQLVLSQLHDSFVFLVVRGVNKITKPLLLVHGVLQPVDDAAKHGMSPRGRNALVLVVSDTACDRTLRVSPRCSIEARRSVRFKAKRGASAKRNSACSTHHQSHLLLLDGTVAF